jgi:hypothetical protein
MSSMSAIEQIKKKLLEYPEVTYQDEDNTFIIYSKTPKGFDIIVIKDPNEYIVCFGNCHTHFDSDKEVVDFVGFGLSDNCRVREFKRGNKAYKWIIESKEGDDWQCCYITGSFFFPFWKSKSEVVYQNRIIVK